MKKAWSRALAALILLLSTWITRANTEVHSLPLSKTSSSEALKDSQAHRINPSKQLDSSFRKIPPSTSNPTQNKFNPPTDG